VQCDIGSALAELDYFLRDNRTEDVHRFDQRTYDSLYEKYLT